MNPRIRFERLFAYNTARDNQLMDLAEQLSDEQLHAPQENGHKSVAETLRHFLINEWFWSHVLRERQPPTDEFLQFAEFPGFDALRERHEQETALFKEYLAGLSEEMVDERLEVFDPSNGNTYPFNVWDVLMHRLLHSAQHRSELAFMLTEFGHSPGDTDYLDYAEEHWLAG